MPQQNENPVPIGPSVLCFDSSCFTKDSFSVDKFLKDHRNKANLKTMRDDLGIYLEVLRSALIDLINKDYADFVNLSSNLIGLDKAIKRIQTPMGQLREELLQVRSSLDGAMYEMNTHLILRHELRERKRSLKSLSRVHTSLKKLRTVLPPIDSNVIVDTFVLERATAEYCQLQFYAQKCQKDLSPNDMQDFEQIGNQLLKCVDKLFLESVSSGEKGKMKLNQSLQFYQSLNSLENAEKLYQKKIVAPVMERLITENSLRSLPRGLPALYEKIIEFLDQEMKILLEVAKQFNKFTGDDKYKFFLKSFWPEVEQKIKINLTSIFDAGDPDIFYQRYSETLVFLEMLFKRCESETLKELHSSPDFTNFMSGWQLEVYFQLRFQETVKKIETGLSNDSWNSKSKDWKLLGTEVIWKSMFNCWDKGVYLAPIAHKFWKLSLQIISRYISWIQELTKPKNHGLKKDINCLVFLYYDVEKFILRLPEFQTMSLNKLPKLTEQTTSLLKESLKESENEIKNQLENISGSIITVLSSDNISLLRQVNDIPRLFRRTNREPPAKPCNYVLNLLEGPKQFHEKHKDNPNTLIWLQSMFSTVTKQYYSSVDDVLNSVQKTEESLRKLKKARDRSSNVIQPNDRRVGDDNKIRLQLLLDVHAYIQGIEGFGLKISNVEKLSELILLVEASQKPQ